MTTISKFYLHDAATPNTGTMPTGAFLSASTGGSSADVTGDATGARTARAADDVIGVAQTSAAFTANANKLFQEWGLRRFVTAPLAAQTFASTDGNWTFSCAGKESSLSHNQSITMFGYCWRPSTGLQVGTAGQAYIQISLLEPGSANAQTPLSGSAVFSPSLTILDGDILVFEIHDEFTQGNATAFTSTFYYDGTTEASATNCASFVTPPAALTLYTPTGTPVSNTAGGPTETLQAIAQTA